MKIIGTKLPDDQFQLFKALTKYSYVNKNSILKKYNINLKKLKKNNKQLNSILELIPGNKDYEKYNKLRNDRLIVTNNKPNSQQRTIGIPQGSAMSALLSNIYLIDFDKDLNELAKNEGFFYRRYCDDILIVCDSEKVECLKKNIIKKIKEEYNLIIQDKKEEVIEFRKNSKGIIRAFNKKKQINEKLCSTNSKNEKNFYKSLQYLGFEFNGQNIFIRSSSLSRYFRKMKGRIIKTIVMAYSPNGKDNKIWKKQLFERYSHHGKRNFLTYAINASKKNYTNSKNEEKEGMNSKTIHRQISRHFTILKNILCSKNNQRFKEKFKKGKAKIIKKI